MSDQGQTPIFTANSRRTLRVVLTFGALLALLLLAIGGLYTSTGQLLDQAALDVAMQRASSFDWVNGVLTNSISLYTVAIAAGVIMLIAAVRGRFALALRAGVMILGANLMTQVLKIYLLHRPYLGIGFDLPNSFPSGHTTLLVSLALALAVVLPREIRSITGFVLSFVVAGLVISIVILGWHRPLDVIGGILVAFMWAMALAPQEEPSPPSDRLNTGAIIGSVIVLVLLITAFVIKRDQLAATLSHVSQGVPVDALAAGSRALAHIYTAGTCAILAALVVLAINLVVYLQTGRKRA